jgi:hypothetical protein
VALHQFLGFPKLVEALRDAVDAIDTDVSTIIVIVLSFDRPGDRHNRRLTDAPRIPKKTRLKRTAARARALDLATQKWYGYYVPQSSRFCSVERRGIAKWS